MVMEDSGTLFGEVNPDLYANNAFRISGLPVNATSRDIRRRSEQLGIMAQLGTDTGTGGGVLPLAERPGATAIADALERLRDPTRRLVDEFFWFWPADGNGHDEAMAALRGGDADAAMNIWEGLSGGAGPEAAAAVHNMAVLAHVRALEDPSALASVTGLWRGAFKHWASVYASDTFWDMVQARIREMSDPRLTPATARQMREALPSVLLSISAQLAFRAGQEGRLADATDHISLMRQSGFGPETADRLLRQHAEPDLAQLRSISQDAERSADEDPHHGAEAARRLLNQAKPLIYVLESVLPKEEPLLQGIRDEVASTALRCAVRYVNETDDLQAGRDVLNLAMPIAATNAARDRIRHNIGIAETRVKQEEEVRKRVLLYGTCWFDKKNPAATADAYPQKMYGDVQRRYVAVRTVRVTWRTQTVNVPRCAACREAHAMRRRTNRMVGWSIFVGSIILIVISYILGLKPLGTTLIFVSLIILLPIAIGLSRTTGVPARRKNLRDFEPIKALLASGWQFGAKPNTR
jgi:hypothetical protein